MSGEVSETVPPRGSRDVVGRASTFAVASASIWMVLPVDDVGQPVAPGRHVDQGHRDGAVGVLDDVGHDARLGPQLDADLPALDRHAVADGLRDA